MGIWNIIESGGLCFGYYTNNKSKLHGINESNKVYWENRNLSFVSNELIILGPLVSNNTFADDFCMEKGKDDRSDGF